ncbi:25424_t:CDS:2, partial [Racocetra persica]
KEEFNTRISSTQQIESINAIVYKYVNLHLTLREFFNGIQKLLASELQKAKYRDYLESLPYNINAVDTISCIEDYSDRRQVALRSLIKRIDPNNIIRIWEVQYMGTNT